MSSFEQICLHLVEKCQIWTQIFLQMSLWPNFEVFAMALLILHHVDPMTEVGIALGRDIGP